MAISIKRGLNVPISGEPVQEILAGPTISRAALIGDDYIGMRPTMLVQEGDQVRLGDPVFEDKKTPGVIFTAPGTGRVHSINRGAKRKFESLVIDLDGEGEVEFESFNDLGSLKQDVAREVLVRSGLWTSLRTRPYSKTPAPGSHANSIFVTAMDTQPLSAEPELIIANHSEDFVNGLTVLTKINNGTVFVCTRGDSRVPGQNVPGTRFEQFDGLHPAGNVGTHIHFLDPVYNEKTVWHVGYQDVIATGRLFTTGRLMTERTVAIGGPLVTQPRLYKTRLGAYIPELIGDKCDASGNDFRVISGSILNGRSSTPPTDYLGRFHQQVTAIEEGNKREFVGWQKPGLNKFSVTGVYLGSWIKGKKFDLNTNINGGHRSMVPVGVYERIMPLDLMPTQLLRSIIIEDTQQAQELGVLELDEEDLALCTYVCPGKYEYGSILRKNLTRIEKEG